MPEREAQKVPKTILKLGLLWVTLLGTVAPVSAQFRARPGLGVTQITAGNTTETLLFGSFPAPGLGFDFTHHAAVNRHAATRALIDPITQHQLAIAREIRRETPAVPVLFPLVIGSAPVIIIQPPVVIVQQAAPREDPGGRGERGERFRYVEREKEREEEAETTGVVSEWPRQALELLFIRRDGGVEFAVAFVRQRDRIIYVTPEGHRRVLPLSEIDVEATVEMNEARGAALHLR